MLRYILKLECEWDPDKARINERKHRIRFEEAITVFDDPFALKAPARTVHGESRFWLIGESDTGVLVVIYTERETGEVRRYRIISARPASKKERHLYALYKNIPL